ncbi:MAG TPA: serine protease [Vicinamibacteria bacterium]
MLVNVRLSESLSDGRARYRVGRALAAIGTGVPPFTTLQARLAGEERLVLGGVTRALADRAVAVMAAEQVRATIEIGGAGEAPAPSRSWRPVAAVVVVALVGAGAWQLTRRRPAADAPPAGRPEQVRDLSPTEIAERGLAATVALRCGDRVGSGFLVERETVVTNAHVVCPGASALRVRAADGRETDGAVEKVEEALDLAVVRAPGLAGQPLPLGDAGGLKAGQRLTIVGSPVGMDFTVHQASVSNVDRRELGVALIQIDGQVNPGNSGGPLIDAQGRVVGVVTLKRQDADGIALAVPINYLHTGTTAPLPGVAGPRSPEFARMAARAEEDSRQLAGELAAVGQRPGLVAAGVVGPVIVARVLWPSAVEPAAQSLRFHLWSGSERICTLEGSVPGWSKVEARDGGSVLPGRVKTWLERNGFASDMYGAQTSLDVQSCPPTPLAGGRIELELEDADSDASRVVL